MWFFKNHIPHTNCTLKDKNIPVNILGHDCEKINVV